MNILYQEDCRVTLSRKLIYDYVLAVPPDFEELGISPDNEKEWIDFNRSVFEHCEPTTGIITIGLTDRKYDSRIIPKGTLIVNMMIDLGYRLCSHKILVKSTGVNLYRLNYTNIYTFSKGKCKQYFHTDFKPDVWADGVEKYDGFSYGMPVKTPERCICNYTKPGDIVYDPFMGSGTTAIAALRSGRNWLGSEISADYCKITNKRIADFGTVSSILS